MPSSSISRWTGFSCIHAVGPCLTNDVGDRRIVCRAGTVSTGQGSGHVEGLVAEPQFIGKTARRQASALHPTASIRFSPHRLRFSPIPRSKAGEWSRRDDRGRETGRPELGIPLENTPAELLVQREQPDHCNISPHHSQHKVGNQPAFSRCGLCFRLLGAHDDPSLLGFLIRCKSGLQPPAQWHGHTAHTGTEEGVWSWTRIGTMAHGSPRRKSHR